MPVTPDGVVTGVVVKVIADAVSPQAQEAVRNLLGAVKSELRRFEDSAVYVQQRMAELLTQRAIPSERWVAPPSELYVPVVSALQNLNQDDKLREMYLRLLATAMDSQTQAKTHPAYAEVLRQLSPADAQALQLILHTRIDPEGYPLYKVLTSEIQLARHLNSICESIIAAPAATPVDRRVRAMVVETTIDNLARLGLIEIEREHSGRVSPLSMPDNEQRAFTRALYRLLGGKINRHDKPDNENLLASVSVERYRMWITGFGNAFIATVVDDRPPIGQSFAGQRG